MNDFFGRFFARLLPVLLLLVMIVVVSRYFFGMGRADIQELALYVHALIFLGCAGWAYSQDEHVRVDIFYRNASPQYQKMVNSFGVSIFARSYAWSHWLLFHRFYFSVLGCQRNFN